MPVKFDPYRSMYVNRNSAKISEILRDRFVQNYATQDKVQQKLLELQSAPFEGDKAAKEALDAQINTQLQQFAERGDYENMTLDVAKLARQYTTQSAPIARNAQAFQADLADKQKMLDSGDISLDTYNKWLRRASKQIDSTTGDYTNYQGLQFDQDGKPISGTFYSPVQLAKDVDVQGEILAELKNLDKVKRGGHEVQMYETVNGIEYAITNKSGIVEYIPQETIMQVTQGVLNRPDVQSYLNQRYEFETMDLDPDSMQSILNTRIDQLRSAGGDYNLAEASRLANMVNTGNIGNLRSATRQALQGAETEGFLNMAVGAHQPSEYGSVQRMKYSEVYMQNLKDSGISVGNQDAMRFIGRNDEIVSPFVNPEGRVTMGGIQEVTQNAQAATDAAIVSLQAMVPELANMETAQVLSTIQNMSLSEVSALASDAAEVDALISAKNAIDSQQTIIATGKRLQEFIYDKTDFTPSKFTNNVHADVAIELGIPTTELASTLRAAGADLDPEDLATALAFKIKDGTFFGGATPSNNLQETIKVSLERMLGVDAATANQIALDVASGNAERVETRSDLRRMLDTVSDVVENKTGESSSQFKNLLSSSGTGIVNFPRQVFLNGDDKKIADTVSKTLKTMTLEELSPVGLLDGTPLFESVLEADGFGSREEMQDIKIEELFFTQGVNSAGVTVPVAEMKFSAGSGNNKVVGGQTYKVPLDQLVPFSGGLGEKLNRAMSTPADMVLNNVRLQAAYAPVLAESGYIYNHKDSKGNQIEFTFLPQIASNGAVTGFSAIKASGINNGHIVNTVFTDINAFHAMFNEMNAIPVE